MTTESAKKFDNTKADHSLIPVVFLDEVARAMQYGAKKYGRYNYTGGLEASRLVAAASRHLYQWFAGEECDKESGISHVAHVAANCLMLLHTRAIGTLKDDRYQPQQVSQAVSIYCIDEKSGIVKEK